METPMTLDELLGACKEASDLGKPIELDALTAQAMVEDSINLSIVIERMALMLGKDPDAVNVHNMLDEFRDIMADFAALKAQAQVVVGRLDSYEEADAPESDSAFYRLSEAISSLEQTMGKINRTSPVLEIAGINHE